jgi:hypothetical protein
LPAIYQTVLKEFKNSTYSGSGNKIIALIRICFALAKRILSDQLDELPPLLKQLESFGLSVAVVEPHPFKRKHGGNLQESSGLSAAVVQTFIDKILAKKDNIYLAALAISGK